MYLPADYWNTYCILCYNKNWKRHFHKRFIASLQAQVIEYSTLHFDKHLQYFFHIILKIVFLEIIFSHSRFNSQYMHYLYWSKFVQKRNYCTRIHIKHTHTGNLILCLLPFGSHNLRFLSSSCYYCICLILASQWSHH